MDITRRSFFKKAGLLIPATGLLPGILLSDIRNPIEVDFDVQTQIDGASWDIDEVGLFSHGKLVKKRRFSSNMSRTIIQGDELYITWKERFCF